MKKNTSRLLAALVIMIFGVIAGIVAGCSTPAPKPTGGAAAKQPTSPLGPQLWAENCGHCHNIRSPSAYSDAQWEVVALHMRVRANLTAEEHRKILAFLKSAH